jgi:hypothetical protein
MGDPQAVGVFSRCAEAATLHRCFERPDRRVGFPSRGVSLLMKRSALAMLVIALPTV